MVDHAAVAIVATQLRKGVLENCVLALLRDQPRYGYELVQELARVDGMLTTEGTIYPLLLRHGIYFAIGTGARCWTFVSPNYR